MMHRDPPWQVGVYNLGLYAVFFFQLDRGSARCCHQRWSKKSMIERRSTLIEGRAKGGPPECMVTPSRRLSSQKFTSHFPKSIRNPAAGRVAPCARAKPGRRSKVLPPTEPGIPTTPTLRTTDTSG